MEKLPRSHFQKHRIGHIPAWYVWKSYFHEYRWTSWGSLVVLSLAILFQPLTRPYHDLLRTALIDLPSIPFEGVEFPIKKVPNWVMLTDAQRRMTYDQLPESRLINLPPYNAQTFQAGKDYHKASDSQRNAYISYPVPNLGNYLLDGTEHSGSHPGIDIKVPINTPVYASLAGRVYKVEKQPDGFGLHIVIESPDVPDPDHPGHTTTAYTLYGHLSASHVKKGNTISRGQLIGQSGDSGMATAPHLHWQIDRAGAPFHGYWPFSWKDLQEKGISSYFEGVKRGVNKDLARQYTIHPAKLVYTFGDHTNIPLVASTETVIPEPKAPTPEPIADTPPEAPEPENLSSAPENRVVKTPTRRIQRPKERFSVSFDKDLRFTPGQTQSIYVTLENGSLLGQHKIELSSTLKGLATISPNKLQASDFNEGQAKITIHTERSTAFRVIAKTKYGTTKSNLFQAQLFTDVPPDHPYFDSIKYVREQNIATGYQNNQFGVAQSLNRAEGSKMILTSQGITPHHIPQTNLSDVAKDAWYAGWVSAATQRKIIQGFADKTFRPAASMTRAEYLKVAILASGKDIPPSHGLPYRDVTSEQWFVDVLAFAKAHDLLDPVNVHFIRPNEPITRGEAAEVLYRLKQI